MLSRVKFALALLLALVAPSIAQNASAADRTTATFNQSQRAAQRSKAATDLPEKMLFDPDAAIYIEADSVIEVFAGRAVFSGNVKLHQGDFLLRTLTLTAFYLGRSGPRRGDEFKAEQLTRVEAKGPSIITSKKDRTATGHSVIFDVMANTVLLEDRVVVEHAHPDEGPRKVNVVTGERVKMDLTSGTLRFEVDGAPMSEEPAGAKHKGAP